MKHYKSTKTYGHERGLSCAFRQWKANSHCSLIHGYALAIRIEFGADSLDANNWVVDFGAMGDLKSNLESMFDHKTVVAEDDPDIDWFREGHYRGVLDLIEVSSTGCERFAGMVFDLTEQWLNESDMRRRCWVERVEVSEHGANSAICERDKDEKKHTE